MVARFRAFYGFLLTALATLGILKEMDHSIRHDAATSEAALVKADMRPADDEPGKDRRAEEARLQDYVVLTPTVVSRSARIPWESLQHVSRSAGIP